LKRVPAAKLAAEFNDYLQASQEQPVLVTRNGKAVAVLLAVRNAKEAEQLAKGLPRSLRSVLKEGQEQIQQGKGIPHDEFWKQVEQGRGDNQPVSRRGRKAK
jgi:prevent-host-death family protein